MEAHGDGTAANPLSVGAGSDDQNIQGSGFVTIGIENGNSERRIFLRFKTVLGLMIKITGFS